MLKVCIQGFVEKPRSSRPSGQAVLHDGPVNRPDERGYLLLRAVVFHTMRDKGTSKGKPRSAESADPKAVAGAEGKDAKSKPAPLTAKEKIAANQKNKRRK